MDIKEKIESASNRFVKSRAYHRKIWRIPLIWIGAI